MGKTIVTSPRIGTFTEFCNARNKQLIRENNEVAIDVPFYQDAIESVFCDLQLIAGDPINWQALIDYIKVKYLVIDREVLGSEDSLVISLVRDLLFQKFGDTILGGDYGNMTYTTAEMGAKALVISQLANDILKRVRVDAGLEIPPKPEQEQKPLSTVSLDYEDYDDTYFLESRQVSKVAGFGKFSSLVKESADRMKVQHGIKALDYCLNKLETVAGSIRYNDVMKVVEKAGMSLDDYLSDLTEEYLATAKLESIVSDMKNSRDEKLILAQAKRSFAHKITNELIEKIKEETL